MATPEFSYVCGLANSDAWNLGNRMGIAQVDLNIANKYTPSCDPQSWFEGSTNLNLTLGLLDSEIIIMNMLIMIQSIFPFTGNCQPCQTADFPKKPIHRVKQSVKNWPKINFFLSFRRKKGLEMMSLRAF